MVLIFLGLIAAPVAAQQLTGISGVCVDDQLFVAYPKHFPKQRTYSSKLVRATFDEDDPRLSWRPNTRVPYDSPITGGVRGGVSKICLAHDRLWAVGPGDELFHAMPLDDLHYFEESDWAKRRESAKFGKRAVNVGGPFGHWVNHLFVPGDIGGENAIRKALKESGLKGVRDFPLNYIEYNGMVVRDTFYDLIPTGVDTITLVHLSAGLVGFPADTLVFREMRLGSRTGAKDYVHPKPLAGDKPQTVKAPFADDFWAYEVGGVYYLLTRKGKLYAVRKNKESVVTATVWDDEKRPLIGAVQDVGRKTVIAFGTDGKDGERFAFDLAFEPKVLKYKTDAKAADGFREAQDCIRAVKKAADKK